MAIRAKKGTAGADGIPIRPMLLAAVLGLLWVVLGPSNGGDLPTPSWGAPVVVATRFLAGFAGGWVAVSMAQIVVRLAWLGATQLWRD